MRCLDGQQQALLADDGTAGMLHGRHLRLQMALHGQKLLRRRNPGNQYMHCELPAGACHDWRRLVSSTAGLTVVRLRALSPDRDAPPSVESSLTSHVTSVEPAPVETARLTGGTS